MGISEILLIAVGLSMDAFAVSIGKGLSVSNLRLSHILKVGIWFGGFQGLMPIIGWLLGATFANYVCEYDHWIAFALLCLIGGNMIKEAFAKDEKCDPDFSLKTMFILAIATSIDALAIGVSFAFLTVKIWEAALIIAITTFVFSIAGIKIGNIFGCRYKSKAELAGGVILILIGTKILVEHVML